MVNIGPVVTLDRQLSLADAQALAVGAVRLHISPFARSRMEAAHRRLARCVAERRVVYGVTTGFGPLADRLVAPEDIVLLQRNLIYHLASGVGAPLPWRAARAAAVARLCSLAQGWSGASHGLVQRLTALINSDLAPVIPEKGTVGASGDLTPLAHLALALMGEGAFMEESGAVVDNAVAFERLGVTPLTLEARDGLALVNGTSVMTGIGVLNAGDAERLWRWGVAITAALAEVLEGRAEAWRAEFSNARPHPGQAEAGARLRARLRGGQRADEGLAAARILPEDVLAARPMQEARAVQDPYSLRCAPQVLGACRDAAGFHAQLVERELNAATDNPIFAAGEPYALHGGNFMGQHVAFASDALSNAVIMLAVLAERQIALVTHERRNGGLPAFLTPQASGLHSGLMGAQVTATALVAEMRAGAMPASIQSISTNADNQDVVSMGTIAARKCAGVIADACRVLSIAALAAAQSVELIQRQGGGGFSPDALALLRWVRDRVDFLDADRPLSGDIETLAQAMPVEAAPSAEAPVAEHGDAALAG